MHDLDQILVLQRRALGALTRTNALQTAQGIYIYQLLLRVHRMKETWFPAKDHRYPTRQKELPITPIQMKHNSFQYEYEGKTIYNVLPNNTIALRMENFKFHIGSFAGDISVFQRGISPLFKIEFSILNHFLFFNLYIYLFFFIFILNLLLFLLILLTIGMTFVI